MIPVKAITTSLAILLLGPTLALAQQPQDQNGAPQRERAGDVPLGHGYVRRNGAIHFIGGGRTGDRFDDTRIDAPSRRIRKGFADAGLRSFKTCEGLDVASFEALSEKYTRDRNRVYSKVVSPGVFLVVQIPKAHAATFEVLDQILARDRSHVWYYEQIQPGVDPATVEIVEGRGGVYKDKDSVHYQHLKIAGADPASFRHLDSAYFVDEKRVYWGSQPVNGADPATFEVLGGSFLARDKKSVFRSGQKMPAFDAASLRLILPNPQGFQIFSDKKGIHLNEMTFPRSKPVAAEVINNHSVKAGGLVHLVSFYQTTPVTVFKENGRLMAETYCYEPVKREPLGLLTAEVTRDGLQNIRVGPLSDGRPLPSVPPWQIEVFKGPGLLKAMLKAGEQIP